jgi:DNA-binding transcriptional MerR regulator/methylmalonyl-CoA mutase cobalamin-binding subunit
MDRDRADEQRFSISAVERDTGLTKDTLRIWERRYRFPLPERDQHGERVYTQSQVDKLRAVKRLIDRGYRPGKIVELTIPELQQLAESAASAHGELDIPDSLRPFTDLIKAHKVEELRQSLTQALHRQGLQSFILEAVAPLNFHVGLAWMRGYFEVFEEHLYTETMQSVLRAAITGIPGSSDARPRVILTTLPNEQHCLGLLMVQGLLSLDGAGCISLGTQTPVRDIALAATMHDADVVALSFSAAFPASHVTEGLAELRAKLPADCELWAGGANAGLPRRPPPGMRTLTRLDEVQAAVAAWRAARTAS